LNTLHTRTVYRAIDPGELKQIMHMDYRCWPARRSHQSIFYLLANEYYATEIAKRWRVGISGCAYVTRFSIKKSFMDQFELHIVGPDYRREWRIPTERLNECNANLIGRISVVATYMD